MNNVIITLRTNEEIKQKLDMIAINDSRSLNNLINKILTEYLKEYDSKKH